jgi:hypothetical protein
MILPGAPPPPATMPRPEDTIRRYLDAHEGSVKVTVRQALSSWELERPTEVDRARIERDLAAVGVECDPPLTEGELDDRVTIRVREESAERRDEPAVPRRAGTGAGAPAAGAGAASTSGPGAGSTAPGTGTGPTAPGPARPAPSTEPPRGQRARDLGGRLGQGARTRAAAMRPSGGDRVLVGAVVAGGVGCLVALGPERIYGYGLALGVLALALLLAARGDEPKPAASGDDAWSTRLRMAAGGLGALALLLGFVGSVIIETGPRPPGADLAEARERDEFCNSSEADQLARLSLQGTRSAEALREATDAVLDIAEDAPPGANCAVLALDAVADAWNVFGDFPEYDDAEEQVERIRDLQEDRGLRESAM